MHDNNCCRFDSTGEKTFKERKKERGAGDISSRFLWIRRFYKCRMRMTQVDESLSLLNTEFARPRQGVL